MNIKAVCFYRSRVPVNLSSAFFYKNSGFLPSCIGVSPSPFLNTFTLPYIQGYQSPPQHPEDALAGKWNSRPSECLCIWSDIAFQKQFWKIKWKTKEDQAFDQNLWEVSNVSHINFFILFWHFLSCALWISDIDSMAPLPQKVYKKRTGMAHVILGGKNYHKHLYKMPSEWKLLYYRIFDHHEKKNKITRVLSDLCLGSGKGHPEFF